MSGLKVEDLKKELKKRCLKTTGKKEELVSHLLVGIENNMPVGNAVNVTKHNSLLNGLDPTAYWDILHHNPTPIPEPTNIDCNLLSPTEMDGSNSTNPKYGFSETFDWPVFNGTREVLKVKMKKKRARKLSPTCQMESNNVKEDPILKGGPNH